MEKQYDILKTELELVQRQIDKYDQIGMQIKTWAVTLWAASAGWSFQAKQKEIIFLSIVLIGTFWFFDGLNKTFRNDYKKRRSEVGLLLGKFFHGENLPNNVSAPEFPEHKRGDILKNALAPHIALPYAVLALVSIIIFYIKF